LIALGVLLSLGAVLAWFFSKTDLGLAVLATSQDAFATRVVGIGIERMSRFIWVSAALLGAIAGILYVPLTGALTPAVMTSNILIPAFTGAVIGGMTSLPGAFVGGIVIGVVQSVGLWAGGHFTIGEKALQEVIPGVEQVTILVVLLVVLLSRPQGLLGKEA
jgi:branched-chain amino acid transport system permease protein